MNSHLRKLYDKRVKLIIEQEKKEPIAKPIHPLYKDLKFTIWDTTPGVEPNLPLQAIHDLDLDYDTFPEIGLGVIVFKNKTK